MSKLQDRRQQQVKLARLEIVATLYKRGHSIRSIRAEVMKRLGLKTYAIGTVHSDIQSLLEEWRESRIEDMDLALQLELERIDDTVRELWEQWEKSKTDYTKTARRQKGSPTRDNQTGQTSIRTYQTERTETEVIRPATRPTYPKYASNSLNGASCLASMPPRKRTYRAACRSPRSWSKAACWTKPGSRHKHPCHNHDTTTA